MAKNDFKVVTYEEKIFLRTPFNYDVMSVSDETGLKCGDGPEDNRTKQEFKDECDINTIVDRFMKTSQMPTDMRLPTYVDYEGIFDFQSAMNTMMEADREFMKMPAAIRAQFENDPQQFLEYATNPNNQEGLIALGLATRRRAEESVPSGTPPSASAPPARAAGVPPGTGKGEGGEVTGVT